MVSALPKSYSSFDAGSAFRIEPLEPRILLSATAAPTGLPGLEAALATGLTELAVPAGSPGAAVEDDDNLFAGATELTPAGSDANSTTTAAASPAPAAIAATLEGAAPAAASGGGPVAAVANVTLPAAPDIADPFSQLVITLRAGQGPPQIQDTDTRVIDEVLAISSGEILSGSGSFYLELINSGVLAPGHSPGVISVASLTQAAAAVMQIELAGTTAGTGYDQINVTGAAALDGTLQVTLLDGFLPEVGDTFDILTFGSVTGEFANGEGLIGFGDGSMYLEVVQLADRIQLVTRALSYGPNSFAIDQLDATDAQAVGEFLSAQYFERSQIAFEGAISLGGFATVSGAISATKITNLAVSVGGVAKTVNGFSLALEGGSFTASLPDSALDLAATDADVAVSWLTDGSVVYVALKGSAPDADLTGFDAASTYSVGAVTFSLNRASSAVSDEATVIDFSQVAGGGQDIAVGTAVIRLAYTGAISQILDAGGALQVGSSSGWSIGSATLTVGAGGTLGEAGLFELGVTNSGTISPGSTGIGTLTVSSLTQNAGPGHPGGRTPDQPGRRLCPGRRRHVRCPPVQLRQWEVRCHDRRHRLRRRDPLSGGCSAGRPDPTRHPHLCLRGQRFRFWAVECDRGPRVGRIPEPGLFQPRDGDARW
jgi:hypothetical protein